jgi:NPCBM/NEW2 domain
MHRLADKLRSSREQGGSMRRWWRSLNRGEKIAIIGVSVTALGVLVALRPIGEGEPPNTTLGSAPTTFAPPTTAFDATDTTLGTSEPPTAATGMVTRYLSWNDRTSDSQEIPWFAGFVSEHGTQEINGEAYTRNLTFNNPCSTTLDKAADYNLGRHYERFQATIGPGDKSTQSYRFEVWLDDRKAYSGTLRHGQSKNLDLSVQNVLKLRVGACSLQDDPSAYQSGGVYGDPQVTGKASEVPPPTTG